MTQALPVLRIEAWAVRIYVVSVIVGLAWCSTAFAVPVPQQDSSTPYPVGCAIATGLAATTAEIVLALVLRAAGLPVYYLWAARVRAGVACTYGRHAALVVIWRTSHNARQRLLLQAST